MKYLRHLYLWFLVFLNLLESYSSQTEAIAEYFNNETSLVTPLPVVGERRDLVKNQLIREVYADVKNMLRVIPGVSENITETVRSVGEVKRFISSCVSEIRGVRSDVAGIKYEIQYLDKAMSKNFTSLDRGMDHRDRKIMQGIKNCSRTVNKLGKTMVNLMEDYKTIRKDLSALLKSLTEIPSSGSPVDQSTISWLMIEGHINISISKLASLLSNQDRMMQTIEQTSIKTHDKIISMEGKLEIAFTGLHQDNKLIGDEIISKIEENSFKTNQEIMRLEKKLEMLFTDLNEGSKLINDRVLGDLLKVMNQISELRQIINSLTPSACQTPTTPSPTSGMKYHHLIPQPSPRFSPGAIFRFWPLIRKGIDLFTRIKNKNPVVGVGGAIGAGKFLVAPEELKNLTGVFGGVSGLAMVPDEEAKILWELAQEIPPLIGIPIPTGFPFGQPTEKPIGNPNEDSLAIPIGNPVGTPRPADPIDDNLPPWWFPIPFPDLGLGEIIDLIWGVITPTEPPILPTGHPEIPQLPPLPPQPTPGSPSIPPIMPIPTIIPGIPGLLPDLEISPRPTIPQSPTVFPEPTQPPPGYPDIHPPPPGYPDIHPPPPDYPDIHPPPPGYPEIYPPPPGYPDIHPPPPGIPTQPPTPRPTSPAPPEPGTVLHPITVIESAGLEGRCLCSCPCSCSCPILPVEFLKQDSSRQWWKQYHHFRKPSENSECNCPCICPCPPGVTQFPPTVTVTVPTTTSKPWLPPTEAGDDLGNQWERPEIVPPETDPQNGKCCQKIDGLTNEIRGLKEDVKVLRITVRDEMVMTREAIMGQMNVKFLEITAALAGIHHANVILHSNDKNATDNVGDLIKEQYTRTYYTLRAVATAISQMNTAVEELGKSFPHDTAEVRPSPYDTYWSQNPVKRIWKPPFSRRSSPTEPARNIFFPNGYQKEKF